MSDHTVKKPRQRGNGALWGGLALMVALLAVAALIGTFVVPPANRAQPVTASSGTGPAGNTGVPAAPSPTLVTPTGPNRPADALGPWAGRIGAAIEVPAVAVQAYAYAQLTVQRTSPQCHLGWTTLAGIGAVDSQHGRLNGAVLEKTGRSSPPVVGPRLDGQEGRPLVADTDAGAYDDDVDFDRGMGPLLLLPSVWRTNASDGDDDQILDPYDIDDASLAVAKVLCAGGEDLSQIAGWTAALGRVQAGEAFAQSVFQTADSYGQRTRNVQ